jgi:uncharacterized protein YbjT (DUF2867 family)
MPRIAIIGGHGKVALHLARILAAQGHEVSSLVRKPEHREDVEATGATAVLADVEHLTTTELAEALLGHDAVVWSAGAGGGNPARTYAVDRDAAIRSMDAASQAGVRRYVMVSYFTSGTDEVPEDNPFFPYARAKAAADDYLRASGLDWTILGPGRLTMEAGTGRIQVGAAAEKGEVSRQDVAQVAAAVLARPDTAGRFITFNNGPTPIAEALTPA